jgi:hypothetical protein
MESSRASVFHGFAKLFRDLPQHDGRGNWLAQLLPHEHHQAQPRRQSADIPVQIKAVEALDLQRHVSVQQFRDGRHPMNSTSTPESPLVGLRSKTSLEILRNFTRKGRRGAGPGK